MPYLAARAIMESGEPIGNISTDLLKPQVDGQRNASAVEDLKTLVNDVGGFMQSTASKVWSLVALTGRDSFHVRTASIDPALMDLQHNPDNEPPVDGGLNRPDSYDQWLIINAPLAVWFIFIIGIIFCLCCICKSCF
ncbi:unnamed protein product [Bursaphelenchus okinawaensis]|uniref:Uncharacterized protein n=1 Tax=Bursaphelenchus okinawaensis TaxID=465554 RepID=A0A811L895_9BILA|nr:unnamed protein product [Bursaphelenchus okinawaensis]CAG9118697.1 unnamed protein product [Bursaphelenchus okinawaensis]